MANISQTAFILGINNWEFTDEETKKEMKGSTVHFAVKSEDDFFKGMKPSKMTCKPGFESQVEKGVLLTSGKYADLILDMDISKTPPKFKICGINELDQQPF